MGGTCGTASRDRKKTWVPSAVANGLPMKSERDRAECNLYRTRRARVTIPGARKGEEWLMRFCRGAHTALKKRGGQQKKVIGPEEYILRSPGTGHLFLLRKEEKPEVRQVQGRKERQSVAG